LFKNYKSIFDAYNELKLNYESIKKENELKDKQIKELKTKIKSATGEYRKDIENCKKMIESQLNDFIKFKETISIQNTSNVEPIEENIKTVNNNECVMDELKQEIKSLQTDYDNTKCKLNRIQIERKSYIEEIRNLRKSNNDLKFKLDFDSKSKENQTNLNKMNYEQTQEKYSIDIEIHIKNMKSIYLFLNETNKSFQRFVDKYSGKGKEDNTNNNERANKENQEETNKNDTLIRDIEPKLNATYANFQQYLSDISMIILSKETNHLNVNNNNDMDLLLSDVDI